MPRKAKEATEVVVEETKEPKKAKIVKEKEETVKKDKKVTKTKEETSKADVKTSKKVSKKEVEPKTAVKTTKKTAKKEETVKVRKATIRSYECLVRPILTEATMKRMETQNKITVEVFKKCNKIEIKDMFEAIFGVKVKQVNVSNVRAKDKRVGKYFGKTSSYKKAIVTLAEGQSLDLLKK